MSPELRAQMLKLVEGKSDGSASISLTADELFAIVDGALYPNMPPIGPGRMHSASKAIAALEGLSKLGYDSRDIANLKKYFDHCAEAEELRTDAGRSLSRMREEFFDDRDKKTGSKGGNIALKAY